MADDEPKVVANSTEPAPVADVAATPSGVTFTGRPTIKPVSRPPHRGSYHKNKPPHQNRLKTAKCFPEIDRRLRLGWSANELTKAVQNEFKELNDLSFKYIRKLIDRHRASMSVVELKDVGNALTSRGAERRLSNGLDELAEIERLYTMQMKRIDIDVGNETNINKLLPTTGNEIFVAMKLLKQSADLKMDLGLNKRQVGTLELTGQVAATIGERYGQDGNDIGKSITDPGSRKKILSLAERLMSLAERSGIDAVGNIIDVESAEVKSGEPAAAVELSQEVIKGASDD